MAQKELRSGGEFNIVQCDLVLSSGKVVGLKASIMGITIFEGLDSLTVTGVITIQDAFNLASFGPIIGQEYLRLKIATPNLKGGENTIDFSSNPNSLRANACSYGINSLFIFLLFSCFY